MRLLIVLAATFLVLNIGIWGLYFFGKDMIKIPEIPAVPKELSFEKPQPQIKLDLPIPEGEKAVLVKKGKTRGLDGIETMVVAEELASKTYHLMIFDNQKTLIFEDKNTLMLPDKILLQVYEGDSHPSFYLSFPGSIPGYHLKWNGYQYIVPENEKDLM
ncbi:hypothetical protein EPN15_01065 [Patescibacteria group bacterium]|nr:MAG: hypothetical protein EPN15_01065 [Patescibacteria group bacterium]